MPGHSIWQRAHVRRPPAAAAPLTAGPRQWVAATLAPETSQGARLSMGVGARATTEDGKQTRTGSSHTLPCPLCSTLGLHATAAQQRQQCRRYPSSRSGYKREVWQSHAHPARTYSLEGTADARWERRRRSVRIGRRPLLWLRCPAQKVEHVRPPVDWRAPLRAPGRPGAREALPVGCSAWQPRGQARGWP